MSKRSLTLPVFVCDPDPELASEIRDFLPQALVEIVDSVECQEEVVTTLAGNPMCTALFGPGWATTVILDWLAEAVSRGFQGGAVLLRRDYTNQLADECRRSGAGGVLPVPVSAEDLVFALAKAKKEGPLRTVSPEGFRAKTVAVFSTKGGVGKTVVATNIAVELAAASGSSVRLLDLDLQFGDVGVMLKLQPQRTIHDLVGVNLDDFDIEKVLTPYGAGLSALMAPLQPELADLVPADIVKPLLKGLCRSTDYVVIDTAPGFDDHILAMLEVIDELLLVVNPDLPSVKNSKLCLKTLGLLGFPEPKIRLVLNKMERHGCLGASEIESSLGRKAVAVIPSDASVTMAVNKGMPVVLEKPQSPSARALVGLCSLVSRTVVSKSA